MSDLEEENRASSDRWSMSEWNEDQKRLFLNRNTESFVQAKRIYEAIQIPGELNTRVRAAIESEQQRRRHRLVWMMSAGAAVILGVCCIMFQQCSKQSMEFTDPSRNVIVHPEIKESIDVLQTSGEAGSEAESEMETILEKTAGKLRERGIKSKKREN
ncbi:MAG: hypothetical protein ACI4D3_12510 [Lachnospiraceae bacterium]